MKKLVSLLLMLVFVFSLSCAMAEGKKHVENLIVGTTAANNTFNMTTQSDAFGRMNYNGLTQGNYVYRDANGDLQPYFFTSYEISEDGKVLDFTWHKGAIWHDGQPVTDEDIIFTFEFQRDVKKVGGLSNLVSVEITGENAKEVARYDFGHRIRAVEEDKDGALWLLEDGSGGRLLKLTPRAED